MLYGVINIDIVNSRKAKNRDDLQRKINKYINMINKKFFHILVAPITITLGDEWQIVISDPSESYNLVQEFQQLFWEDNIELYAGLGIGTILTEIDEDVRNMDGPCFVLARKAIEIAKTEDVRSKEFMHTKRNRVYFYCQELIPDKTWQVAYGKKLDEAAAGSAHNNGVNIDGESHKAKEDIDFLRAENYFINLGQVINAIIENNEIHKSKMTSIQKKLFIDYAKYGSYRKIIDAYEAESRNMSIGNISMRLHDAEYFVIQHNLKLIKKLLASYCKMWGVIF